MLVFLLVWSSLWVWTLESDPSLRSSDVFAASDKCDFAVEVPAATKDCFWHFARRGGSFYLTYLVQWATGMASDLRLIVTLTSPGGAVLGSRNSAGGLIMVTTAETGFYPVCFANFHNRFGTTRVFVTLDVIYKDLDPVGGPEEALGSTLTSLEVRVQRLQRQLFLVWHHYKLTGARESRDQHLLSSTLSYVSWWSASQSLVIVLTGLLQIFILRRLFRTDAGRTRC
ncbi:uncharacterized protein V6R79_013091 [Siganus canaliculatus]